MPLTSRDRSGGRVDGALVERLATVGLDPVGLDSAGQARSDPPPGLPLRLDEASALAVAESAPHEGLVCLAGAAIARGDVEASAAAREIIEEGWAARMAATVRLDGWLVDVSGALRCAGIPARALKGAALAHLDEIDPAWRSYGDIDVLVPPDALLEALEVLEPLGLRPTVDPLGYRWAARHAKSVSLDGPEGIQVDLHRQLAAGPFGVRLDARALFAQGRPFEVGGQPLVALGDEHRVLHATYHAALGGVLGVRHRRDVLLLAGRTTPDVVAHHRHEGWSPVVVAAAVAWADPDRRWLGAGWHSWAGAWLEASTPDYRLLDAYDGSFADLARAEFRATRGLGARVGYARSIALPSRANLAARGLTRTEHVIRLAKTPLVHRGAR